jgi:hypothetical protein
MILGEVSPNHRPNGDNSRIGMVLRSKTQACRVERTFGLAVSRVLSLAISPSEAQWQLLEGEEMIPPRAPGTVYLIQSFQSLF